MACSAAWMPDSAVCWAWVLSCNSSAISARYEDAKAKRYCAAASRGAFWAAAERSAICFSSAARSWRSRAFSSAPGAASRAAIRKKKAISSITAQLLLKCSDAPLHQQEVGAQYQQQQAIDGHYAGCGEDGH